MKTFKLKNRSYSMTEASAQFLTKYLERIGSYIQKKHLESEFLDDIEERIVEQLDAIAEKKEDISQEDVIRIVNEMGEPEEIFDDFDESDLPKKEKNQWMETLQAWLLRIKERLVSDEAIFFGFCSFLHAKTKIPTLFFRIVFLLLALFSFAGVFFYLLGSFLFLGAAELHARRTTITNGVKGFWAFLFDGISGLILFAFQIIRFFFFAWISLLLLGVAGFGAFSVGVLHNTWVIENQDILAFVPDYLSWSVLVCSFSALLLAIAAFGAMIKKHFFPSFLTIVALFCLFGGGMGVLSGGFSVASHYTQEFSRDVTFSFPVEENQVYAVQSGNFFEQENRILPHRNRFIALQKSKDEEIHFVVTSTIQGSGKSNADEIFAELIPIEVSGENKTFVINRNTNETFKNVVPFSFIGQSMVIEVPEKVSLQFDDRAWRIYNIDPLVTYNGVTFPVHESNTLPVAWDESSQSFRPQPSKTVLEERWNEYLQEAEHEQVKREAALYENILLLNRGAVQESFSDAARIVNIEWEDPVHSKVFVVDHEKGTNQNKCFRLFYTSAGPWPDEVLPCKN